MSLEDSIKKFKKQFLSQVPDDIQEFMQAEIDELKQSGLEDQCCKTGDKARTFLYPI